SAIQESGASAFAVHVDLSKREQVEGLIDRLEEEEGPIDILINCAGIGLQAQTLEIREEDMRLLFEVNHFAMVALSRDAFRHVADRIWSAIRRPKAEIYTSLLARFVLALDGINPRWLDRVIAWQRRKMAA